MWTTVTYTVAMDEKFNDLGVDAVIGGDLMYKVGITEEDLRYPANFEKMKDVIAFLKGMPKEERDFFADRILAGKNVDKLDYLWNYIELTKKSEQKKTEFENLKKLISAYEREL